MSWIVSFPGMTWSRMRHHHRCRHRSMVLVWCRCSRPWGTMLEGSSWQSCGSVGEVCASGLRLITSSSLSPASVMRGTARQQSKSLVRTWFTWTEESRGHEHNDLDTTTATRLPSYTTLRCVTLIVTPHNKTRSWASPWTTSQCLLQC